MTVLSRICLANCRRMPVRNAVNRPWVIQNRLGKMASQFSSASTGTSLGELPKSNVFTSKLPPDPAFETPASSHSAPRETLGPRMVRGALYTYVRPEPTEEPELLGVSSRAMEDLGLKPGEELTPEFKEVVSGNKIFWDEENGGVYPWAQCYGGKILPCFKVIFNGHVANEPQAGNCKATHRVVTGSSS